MSVGTGVLVDGCIVVDGDGDGGIDGVLRLVLGLPLGVEELGGADEPVGGDVDGPVYGVVEALLVVVVVASVVVVCGGGILGSLTSVKLSHIVIRTLFESKTFVLLQNYPNKLLETSFQLF